MMTEIICKTESYAIIGACFEVYNEKGCRFLEPVYQECLGIEFEYQRIPAIAKPSLAVSYHGRILKQTYEPGYVCFEKIIVELKAFSGLTDEHRAQLLNYLHATGFELVSGYWEALMQRWAAFRWPCLARWPTSVYLPSPRSRRLATRAREHL